MRNERRRSFAGESRRDFLGGLAAVGGFLLVKGARPSWADEPDVRVEAILTKTVTVDMHNHGISGTAATQPPPSSGMGAARPENAVEAMQRAGDTAICLAPPPDAALMDLGAGAAAPGTRSNLVHDPRPGELYQVHLRDLDQMDQALARLNLRRVLTYADLEAAKKESRPAIIHDSEGADFLEGHLDRLEHAYKRGLRKLQFVHYAVNDVGDYQIGPVEHHGLSLFGTEVVKECNRLGIIVDTAHGTFEMVKGAAKATSKPIVLSHTALKGSKAQGAFWAENFRGGLATMQARQVTPEHAKAVADTGGVVGIWHLFPNAEKYVEGMREMADVVGVDHVGIGMDWPVEGINHIWPSQTQGMMYTVIGEMLKQGFTPEECGKIAGGNFCRVFKACV
jgi:membrane dipeptidase